MATENAPEILTLEQAAAFLQVSPRTVQRLVAEGRMPGRQVGSQWRFDREQLREWVRGESGRRRAEPTGDALVESERRRLGVDLPGTLVDMQRGYARARDEEPGRD